MTDVVLGDDHAVFLDALSAVLTELGCTVTKATTVAQTVLEVTMRQPDLCLIDRHFAVANDGIDALAQLVAASPATKVLILSADGEHTAVRRAMGAGAARLRPQDAGRRRPQGDDPARTPRRGRCRGTCFGREPAAARAGAARCGAPRHLPDGQGAAMPAAPRRGTGHHGHRQQPRRVRRYGPDACSGPDDEARRALPAGGRGVRGPARAGGDAVAAA